MGKILDFFLRRKLSVCLFCTFFIFSSSTSYFLLSQHEDLTNNLKHFFVAEQKSVILDNKTGEVVGTQTNLELTTQTIIKQIEEYRANTSTEILSNKKLDQVQKANIVNSYNQLPLDRQEPYHDFIQQLEQGSAPSLQYHGQTSYPVYTEVNFTDLITASDPEDGKISLDKNNLKIEPTPDFTRPGIQDITIQVNDQDGNIAKLDLQLIIYPLASAPVENQAADDSTTNNQNTVEVPSLGESGIKYPIGSGANFTGSTVNSSGIFQATLQTNEDSLTNTTSNFLLPLILATIFTLVLTIAFLIFILIRDQRQARKN